MKKHGKINLNKSLAIIAALGLGLSTTPQIDQILRQESVIYAQTEDTSSTTQSDQTSSTEVDKVIRVLDKSNKPIANINLTITSEDDTVYTFTTDENGEVNIEDLANGTYTVKADGETQDQTITITDSSIDYIVNIPNVIPDSEKTNETSDTVSTTESEETESITKSTENTDSKSEDDKKTDEIESLPEAEKTPVKGNVINVRSKDDKALDNVKVVVKDKEDKEVAKLTSDQEGQIILANLLDGEYTLEVVKAPEGYTTHAGVKVIIKDGQLLDDDYVLILGKSDPIEESSSQSTSSTEKSSHESKSEEVSSDESSKVSSHEPNSEKVSSSKNSIKESESGKEHFKDETRRYLQVTDSKGKPLANTKVNVYDKDGKLLAVLTTDENGYIDITDLPSGELWIALADKPKANQKVTIDEAKEDNKVKLPNTGEKSNKLVYGLGIVLIIGGVGVYFYSKRNEND